MNQSEHYNLNLVEGSDLVNPLVQDVPNYEAIDEQMYKNEQASVGKATELTSGTVHTLTRTGTQPIFRFTATSNFNAGETFVVDGVQVTALTPSGETLPSGAYIIGSEVLCALRDTLLTVFVAGSVVADNALKLGGEEPSYYGKAEDVATAQSTATAAGVLAQANAQQIVELNAKTGLKILWSNPNPNTAFANQDITLTSNDYDFLVLIFDSYMSNKENASCTTPKAQNFLMTSVGLSNNGVPTVYIRGVRRVDDTHYTVGDCLGQRCNSNNYTIINSNLIPLVIYGGKLN